VRKLLPLISFGLIAAVFSLPAAGADEKDRDRSKAGAGASSEGGASLAAPHRLRRPPTSAAPTTPTSASSSAQARGRRGAQGPHVRKPPAERGNASSGATSKGRAELSEEADKQDEEFRKKTARRARQVAKIGVCNQVSNDWGQATTGGQAPAVPAPDFSRETST